MRAALANHFLRFGNARFSAIEVHAMILRAPGPDADGTQTP
jgi:hypothetical protein